jgi:hypothetical protein|tara:strand:+ start:363 stop:680 length:318 start_codon:yes stop_codon:yes gene_type:complete
MVNIDKLSEGIHYELTPANTENTQGWDVRILEGDYIESVIRFGNVAFNEQKDSLTFNFKLISSPDNDLTEENMFFQQYVGSILEDILERSVADGSAIVKEKGSLV